MCGVFQRRWHLALTWSALTLVFHFADCARRSELAIKDLPEAEDKDVWLPVQRWDHAKHRSPLVCDRDWNG